MSRKEWLSPRAPVEHRVEWWFVELDARSTVDWHDHHQAEWSAIYYPAVGFAPSTFVAGAGEGQVMIFAAPGMLIQFPATLRHKAMGPRVDVGRPARVLAMNFHAR